MNKVKNLILFAFLLLGMLNSYSQKEANIWYFGGNSGLDFNSGSPVSLTGGQLNTSEGCASIADSNGNLLFYTDGSTIWNRNHLVMLNGSGLNGHPSSTNSSIIVPKPNSNNIYFVFTVDAQAGDNGLQYSEVDMNLNNGLGGVNSVKNILLHTPTTEKLTAIKSSLVDEYWVVSHKWGNNEFIAYKITSDGINTVPVVSATGTNIGPRPNSTSTNGVIGSIKFSSLGNKLAVANVEADEVQIFNFNFETGVISNPITINDLTLDPYGVEFSPKNNVLYVGRNKRGVYQYNLLAGSEANIRNSKIRLTDLPTRYGEHYGQIQLATDGKIYVAAYANNSLHVINNPNVLGLACDFQVDAIPLHGLSYFGLPTFIQSYFNIDDIIYEKVCFGNETAFSLKDVVDTVVWDFGDPASGVNNTSTDFEPRHLFSSPGNYEVTVIATLGADAITKTTTVTIYEQPVAHSIPDQVYCDYLQNGEMTIDMSVYTADILNGQDPNTFSVTYYDGIANYNNNVPLINNQFNLLTLASADPVASVRNINNPECEAITTIHVSVLDGPNPNLNISDLTICDNTSVGTNNDGLIQFDLTTKELEILNGQSSADFSIAYFTDITMLNEIGTPDQYENSNVTETIYVKVESKIDSICTATTSFNIEVLELPTVNSLVELKQCDDDLDGFSPFNLNEAINKITANTVNETITFHESQLEAISNSNPIINTSSYTNQIVSSDVIWARIVNTNNCFDISQIDLTVTTTQIPDSFIREFYKCDDLNDGDSANGISTFDFSSVNSEIEAMFPSGQQPIIKYYKNQADALAELNPILDISNYRNIGYPNTQNIYVRVDSGINNDCLGLGHHITLYVEQQPIAYSVNISEQCDADGDGMFEFDTSNIESQILNGQAGMQVAYIDEQGNTLPSPLPNPFLTGTQEIKAIVTNISSQDPNGRCTDETTLSFIVDAAVVAYPVNDLINCDTDNDGIYEFDTSSIESQVLNGQTGMLVFYTDANGNQLPSPLPNPLISSSQEITIRIENPLSSVCYDETTFDLVTIDQPVLNMNDTWLICEGESVDVIADIGYDEYLWSTGETSSTITVFNAGTYEITTTNVFNGVKCETSKTITVVESNVATITDIVTEDWTADNNVITVFVEGNGDYEYSLDGFIYQDDNRFTNLQIKDYTVYVRDKKGCGIVTEEVFLMYYPKFFTPNNDGYHDTWNIYNSSLEPNNRIYIFDRYGKLLKQLNPLGNGWDGTFNGEQMPSNDYWFVVERQNGKQYKGHFTLKR